MPLWLAAVMVALAWACAYCAGPSQRADAVFVAKVLAGVWLAYAMPWIYEPLSPAGMLYRIGLTSVTHEHVWAAGDLIGSVLVVARAGHTTWGLIIWGLYIAMLGCHALRWASGADLPLYSPALNAAFALQLLVLALVGGGSVLSRLSRGGGLRRIPVHQRLASHSERRP
jgi:hypothetical protein